MSILSLSSWILCHLLANLFPSFWLFLVLFRMLSKLVTVNKPFHEPHMLWIIGTIFAGAYFSVCKEWVRSWSHASFVFNLKSFPKNFWQSFQKQQRDRKREEKLEWWLWSFLRYTQMQKQPIDNIFDYLYLVLQ